MSALLAACTVLATVSIQRPQPQVHPLDRTPVFLHLVDERGDPYTQASGERDLRLGYSASLGGFGAGSFEWLENPAVFCAPTREDVLRHPRLRMDAPLSAAYETEPGVFRFLLEPGLSYILGIRGGAVPWISTELLVPVGSTLGESEKPKPMHRTLTVSEKPIEEVRLRISNPQGRPVCEQVAFQIEDATTGLPLVSRLNLRSAEQILSLPSGEYRVRAYSRASVFWCGNEMLQEVIRGGATTPLSLSGTKLPAHELRFDRGGRILVNLSDLTRVSRDQPQRVELALLPVAGWPFRLEFVERKSRSGGTLLTSLAPGDVQISELIPAGRYQLFAKTRDGRTALQEIEIRETETVEAILLFETAK